uniref:Uncharacterized protein n=1 Tax=Tetranychus urticae TaxID=32264 RepID=T1KCA2_TETUR
MIHIKHRNQIFSVATFSLSFRNFSAL